MENPSEYYQKQIGIYTKELQTLRKGLAFSSTLRLLVFITACFRIYFFFGNLKIVFLVLATAIAVFIYLVSKHSNLQYQRDLKKALIAQNELELKVLDRVFHHLPSGESYNDPLHFYSQDIDLFGRGSFFQYLNRTALESGSDFLAKLFTENKIDSIPQKQDAIRELSAIPKWRQQ